MLRDYSRRPIPIFAQVNLVFSQQGKKVTAPGRIKDHLVSHVVLPLGLMVPGPGVCPREVGMGAVGTVKLVRAERVPSQCGVGTLLVEPSLNGLEVEIEHTLVQVWESVISGH